MRLALASLALAVAGCATTGFPDVIDPNQLPSSFGAPRITRVRDIGNVRLPETGPWKGDEDGVAVPGELIYIEGDNFGRQPTVSVGGRATSIVARTDGGGIVARVPTGVAAGEVAVMVSQPKGRAEHKLAVRRFGLVAHGGQLFLLDVRKDSVQALPKTLSLPGARRVAIAPDGAVAYVLASGPQNDRLVVVDLAASGGPRLAGERVLTHRAQMLTAAEDGPQLAAIGDGKLTLFALTRPLQPAPWDASALPLKTPPRAAALSPDGKLLALLQAEGNQLVLLDVDKAQQPKLVTQLALLPDQRLPLVRDLAFSTDGETLWVVSGDNAESLPALQPTRLTAVRLVFADAQREAARETAGSPPPAATTSAPHERLLSVFRTQSVPGAAAPLRMTVARGQPLASGTTIRMPPEKAAVFLTALNDALFKLAKIDLTSKPGATAAAELWKPPQPGMMVRADINGGGGPLFATREILSAVELTPDAQLVVATAARVAPSPPELKLTLDFGVTVSPVWGSPAPTFYRLGSLEASEVKPPFELGDVKIQP